MSSCQKDLIKTNKQTHTHTLDGMPSCRRVCKHVQLKLMMEEISALAFKSQAPGSGYMLHVTCVNVGARCVFRGAGDCTMDVMFAATASRLSTSAPLKRSTATMAAIMRKSSTPLHRHTHKLSRCEKLQILRLFLGGGRGGGGVLLLENWTVASLCVCV